MTVCLKPLSIFKRENWINVIFFSILWFFSVLNYANVDYDNYRLIYEYYIPNGAGLSVMPDFGYYFLCKLGISIGLNFVTFRGIYITVALLFFVSGINYLSLNNKNVYVLYAFFPFCLEVVQFRFFMAVALMIYALRFLYEKKMIAYVLFIIIGAIQHSSSLVYLLFLLSYMDYKRLKRFVLYLTVGISGVFLVVPSLLSRLFGKFFSQLNIYLSLNSYTIYLFVIHLVMAVFAVVWNRKIAIKEETKMNIFLQKALLIMICFTPFIMLNQNFTRLYRGGVCNTLCVSL